MKYYIETIVNTDFDEAVKITKEALKHEGFGVLSEINMDEKFKEKLNKDFRKYKILGACNPPLAYEAIQSENKIGTMLPCNVIIQQIKPNKIEIAAIDPEASMMAIDNIELKDSALKVKRKLEQVIHKINSLENVKI